MALELLVQNLGGAEAVVVLDGPLQRRLGEGLVGMVLVAVEQDLVEQGDVVDVLEDDPHYVGTDLACRGLEHNCVLALISRSFNRPRPGVIFSVQLSDYKVSTVIYC